MPNKTPAVTDSSKNPSRNALMLMRPEVLDKDIHETLVCRLLAIIIPFFNTGRCGLKFSSHQSSARYTICRKRHERGDFYLLCLTTA